MLKCKICYQHVNLNVTFYKRYLNESSTFYADYYKKLVLTNCLYFQIVDNKIMKRTLVNPRD